MARKRNSDEFKQEAVAMTRLPGVTLQQVGAIVRPTPGTSRAHGVV